ncbi:hypothetical protein GGS20DRAFT_552164, partial [Poronia punctata]
MTWGTPIGLPIRTSNDENLVIFRKALGIHASSSPHSNSNPNPNPNSAMVVDSHTGGAASLEEGRREATGIYRTVIQTQTRLRIQHALLSTFLYLVYFSQILIGAALTSLGSIATTARTPHYAATITILGALNTVLAGVLALIKGSGQPQKLGKDRVGFRRLQDWIEETEAMIAVGVIGRDRRDVGILVECAFKQFNAARRSVEDNDPDFYVPHRQEAAAAAAGRGGPGGFGKGGD